MAYTRLFPSNKYFRLSVFCIIFRLKKLIGYEHPTVWKLLEVVRKEDSIDRAYVRKHIRGEPVTRRVRRETVGLNRRLLTHCVRYRDGLYNMEEFLRHIGACVRLIVRADQ